MMAGVRKPPKGADMSTRTTQTAEDALEILLAIIRKIG